MTEEDQYKLDFEGDFADKMNAMRGRLQGIDRTLLKLEDGSLASLSEIRWENAREAAMAIFSHANAELGRYCQTEPERVRETAGLKHAAWYRARRDLVEVGLLIVSPDRSRYTGERLPDRLEIDAAMIEDYRVASQERAAERRRVRASALPEEGRRRPKKAETARNGPNDIEETLLPLKPSTNPPPPTPALSSDADRLNGVVGWEEVFETLEAIGLVAGAPAIAAARNAGAEPSDVAELVGVWHDHQTPKPPAWDRGALYTRLMIWRPGQSPLECWPKWHADHARARQRLERDARDRREAELLTVKRREHEARAARAVADRQSLGELEAIARAMAREEYSALLATIPDPVIRAQARRDPYSSFVLPAIADALNQRRTSDGAGV